MGSAASGSVGSGTAGRCRLLLPSHRAGPPVGYGPSETHKPVPAPRCASPVQRLELCRAPLARGCPCLAPGMGSGAGGASWARAGICSAVKTGGSSPRAFSLLWHLPRSSPKQRNLGPLQSSRGPWTPLRHAPPTRTLFDAVGRAVLLCPNGVFFIPINSFFLQLTAAESPSFVRL